MDLTICLFRETAELHKNFTTVREKGKSGTIKVMPKNIGNVNTINNSPQISVQNEEVKNENPTSHSNIMAEIAAMKITIQHLKEKRNLKPITAPKPVKIEFRIKKVYSFFTLQDRLIASFKMINCFQFSVSAADPKFRPGNAPFPEVPRFQQDPNSQYVHNAQISQQFPQQSKPNRPHSGIPTSSNFINSNSQMLEMQYQYQRQYPGQQSQVQNSSSAYQNYLVPTENVQPARNQFFRQPTIASQYMQPTQKIFRQPTIELDENGDMIKTNAVINEMQEIPGKNIIINRHGKGKSEIDYSSAMTGLKFDEQGNLIMGENLQKNKPASTFEQKSITDKGIYLRNK